MQQYRMRSYRSLLWGTVSSFVVGTSVFAADAVMPSGFATQASSLTAAGEPIKYLFTSLFYIALMFGIFALMRKYVLPQNMSAPGYEHFRVIRKVALEPQASVYLLRSGKSVLMLGVGAKQITLIKELSQKEAAELLRPVPIQPLPIMDTFKKHLAAVMERKK